MTPIVATDLVSAHSDIGWALGIIGTIGVGAVAYWVRISRARTAVHGDGSDRRRVDALASDAAAAREEAAAARREAHDMANDVMAVQRQLGRLEAQNEACQKHNAELERRTERLELQNAEQAAQIDRLSRALKGRFNPSETDHRP